MQLARDSRHDDPATQALRVNRVRELQAALTREREREEALKNLRPDAAKRFKPSATGRLTPAEKRRREYLVETASPQPAPVDGRAPIEKLEAWSVAAEVLPGDMLTALREESAFYRSICLPEAKLKSFDREMVRVDPHPAADSDWVGGRLLGFDDHTLRFVAEVVHFDAESGDVFGAHRGHWGADDVAAVRRWVLEPFDFSRTILAAASACRGDAQRIALAVQRVLGERGAAMSAGATSWLGDWHLLWGPPGTGKTERLAGMLESAVREEPGKRIVVVAPTNRAVDELVRRVCGRLEKTGELLRDGQCRVFRGGNGVTPELAKAYPTVLSDPAYREIRAQVSVLKDAIRSSESTEPPEAVARLRAELRALEAGIPDETVTAVQRGSATLVFLTVHRALSLVSELGSARAFWKLVIDEGGMVSRAAAALLTQLAETCLVAGDPQQIGPVTRSAEGASSEVLKWLRTSPLSHLKDAARDALRPGVELLREQHRMHPEIREVVSRFCYAGQLTDGPGPQKRATEPCKPSGFPSTRAAWIVLDECEKCRRDLRLTAYDRPRNGRGYNRRSSAELAIAFAEQAANVGQSVLIATPYRAQVRLLESLGKEWELPRDLVHAATIHRQQGAEYDVVVVDTVAGGRPFQASDLLRMLNVAASRARQHLLVIASEAEASAAVPNELLSLLPRFAVTSENPLRVAPGGRGHAQRKTAASPTSLGASIESLATAKPILSDEQVRLASRNFGEGHFLVRGVAGSGKTFVLAKWVAHFLRDNSESRVLVSFFNKALRSLIEQLVKASLQEEFGAAYVGQLERVAIQHVAIVGAAAAFDAVFVDEAQDVTPADLTKLYYLARENPAENGKPPFRRFFLFLDDSQNVYGRLPVDQFRGGLREELSFAGRARVMKEAHRSTKEILDLAFNVVLDPLENQSVANPGMREFMKANELAKEGLLRRPDEGLDGLYHVDYTERSGPIPQVILAPDIEQEWDSLAACIQGLIDRENVREANILVVSPVKPATVAEALCIRGVRALAYGGSEGADTGAFPTGDVEHVRVTTVFSCKGHEDALVFFCGLDWLDSLEAGLGDFRAMNERERERAKRSLFYVGATRARLRQWLLGTTRSRFGAAAAFYAAKIAAGADRSVTGQSTK